MAVTSQDQREANLIRIDEIIAQRKQPSRRVLVSSNFAEYHEANPHIYLEFEKRALALAAAGATRIAVAKLREEIRADMAIQTLSEEYKLSNSFTPDYARMLVEAHPDTLGHLIVLKQRKEIAA